MCLVFAYEIQWTGSLEPSTFLKEALQLWGGRKRGSSVFKAEIQQQEEGQHTGRGQVEMTQVGR